MPKFTVTIEELIKECRTYEIDAENAKDAATVAHSLWIVNGELTPEGEEFMGVEERTYEVLPSDGSPMEEFDVSEIENEGEPEE